jgi:hypothetical protein
MKLMHLSWLFTRKSKHECQGLKIERRHYCATQTFHAHTPHRANNGDARLNEIKRMIDSPLLQDARLNIMDPTKR